VQTPTCIDFETEAIEDRPAYPPRPVGVAIQEPGLAPQYFAWGHPEGNNSTVENVKARLQYLWQTRDLLFHNAKFDLEVAHVHLGLPLPAWHKVHDTLFLLFLANPYAKSLSLKPASVEYLKMPAEEQDKLKQHLVELGVIRPAQVNWGAYISKGHGQVVGDYAIGDVDRTVKLWLKLYPGLDEGMRKAYDRERQLLPILMRNEREGMRVDLPALKKDQWFFTNQLDRADKWLRRRLKVRGLNVDSNDEVATALKASGVVPVLKKTPTGKDSVAKANLTEDMFTDLEVYRVLGYRNRLSTCLTVFMRPWLELASANKGRIFTSWNQVRSTETGGYTGTRTGRLSCSPNFQNVPKTWDFELPKKFPALPLMRSYILPDAKQVFVHRDYSQQEMRILAHYEDGDLMAGYLSNPRMDIYLFTAEAIKVATGRELTRQESKILTLALPYGMGIGKLASALKCSEEDARAARAAQMRALPSLRWVLRTVEQQAKSRVPVRTWGGRTYFAEAGYEYKMLNTLIQGSAADCTKEAVIRYDAAKKTARFLVTVHDEINISSPAKVVDEESRILRDVMESVEFDVQMLTDAKRGPNWGSLRKEES
jgi:DNA polymerase I-like protein with 3'-5' exonuclease and polymerase domains